MEKEKNMIKKIKKRKILSAKQINSYSKNEFKTIINKINSLATRKNNAKIKEIFRPSTSFLSTNINNFRYLFDNNNKETINNTKWVLNLRLFDDKKIKKKKLLGEPRFYQEDLEKFIRKKTSKLEKSKSTIDFENLPNLNKYKHFFNRNNDKHGTIINKPLLNYSINLRHNNIKILHKWNSNINIKDNKYFYSCINLSKEDIKGRINNNNIMRPYKVNFIKEEYNGDKILKKSYSLDQKKAYNIFGEHCSSPPYNDKYVEKNYAKINNLLNAFDKNQGKTWYQIKLRNFIDGFNDKLQKNKKVWKNY